MREIKFRAWDNNSSLMINVFTLYNEGTGSVIPQTDQHSSTTGTERYKIMQYTGLKDKNSKEIYEGDIVFEPKMRKKAVVSWRNERATFWLTDGKEREILLMLENNRYEIIGNIYENPELIK